jgi:vacuolar-type H+-ATPase subunit E/Vma4
VEENESLKKQIAEIVEFDCLGGVMAESMDGMVSIDNTFDMRLEMLTPKILPRIGRDLFGDDEK